MDPRSSQHWESSLEDLSVTAPLLPLHDEGGGGGAAGGRRPCSALASRLVANKYLAIAAGPLASALVCSFVDFGAGRGAARNMLGVLAWVFIWWLTDAVPLGVASMAPLFLFPAFGISSSDAVAKAYMDDVISLVLGSFILALAIEHYNIHRRLALNITSLFCGDPVRPPLLLLGICGTTMFISMWIHNTPCTVMMMPVATGILQRFPRGGGGGDAHEVRRFSKAVVLGVTYASTIGGMSTLTGTGANIILVGMWSTYFPEQRPITFSSWMSFGFPVALVLFAALWITLCLLYCSKNTGRALSAYLDRTHLRRELSLLGPMAFAEKMVLAVFGGLIVLWMTRSLTNDIPGWGVLFDGKVGDGTVTVSIYNPTASDEKIPVAWAHAHRTYVYDNADHDGDAALHNPDRQGRRREAHGLGQVPEAAVEHHPPPRRRLRHRRGLQGERPHGHPLGGARLPQGRAAAGDRARGLRLQRRHYGVHVRRRGHHAGAAAARAARQHHRRAPAAAHGPRHHRRAALVPAAHRLATQRRRLRHRLHHHQGYGAHRDAPQSGRRCNSRRPTANARFCGFRHGPEINILGT